MAKINQVYHSQFCGELTKNDFDIQYMYRKLPVFPKTWSNDFELFKLKSLYIISTLVTENSGSRFLTRINFQFRFSSQIIRFLNKAALCFETRFFFLNKKVHAIENQELDKIVFFQVKTFEIYTFFCIDVPKLIEVINFIFQLLLNAQQAEIHHLSATLITDVRFFLNVSF